MKNVHAKAIRSLAAILQPVFGARDVGDAVRSVVLVRRERPRG